MGPGPIPYFRGDWSWNNFYGHSPPFRWIIQEGLLSATSESMCTKYWLTACSSLPRKKSVVRWTDRHDHDSCWLGTLSNKTSKQTEYTIRMLVVVYLIISYILNTLIRTAKKPANITAHWKTSVHITAFSPPYKVNENNLTNHWYIVQLNLCKTAAQK